MAFSAPTPRLRTPPDLDPLIWHAARGVAHAVHTLLINQQQGLLPQPDEDELPLAIDERFMPLCNVGAPLFSVDYPLVSFVWNEIPPVEVAHDFVCVLAENLTTVQELVVAYVLFEKAIRSPTTVLASFTVRPLLVACVVLAVKITGDEEVSNAFQASCLRSDFTALTARHLLELERQVLVLVEHHIPTGPIYQTYADALFDAANHATFGEHRAAPEMIDDF